MHIEFDHVIPAPLAGVWDKETQIWDTNAQFEHSKMYQVNAPSGKGKSTFIHLIYGLRQDFTGTIRLNQQDIRSLNHKQWAELRQRKISIVFQSLRLFAHLSVQENLRVKQQLLARQTDFQIKEMAFQLGISHLLDKKVGLLSYGERQRVAIIRALIQPFELLLLDEPFSHLDEENIANACQLISQKCQENKAGLIMTSLGYPYYLPFDKKLIL